MKRRDPDKESLGALKSDETRELTGDDSRPCEAETGSAGSGASPWGADLTGCESPAPDYEDMYAIEGDPSHPEDISPDKVERGFSDPEDEDREYTARPDDDFRPILAGITIPTLHVTTADDVIRIPGFGSGVDYRLKVFDAIGGANKVLAVYRHGTHNVFTDHRYFDSREVSEDVKRATESLSLAFIDTVYGTSTAGLAQWRSGHRALLARYETR